MNETASNDNVSISDSSQDTDCIYTAFDMYVPVMRRAAIAINPYMAESNEDFCSSHYYDSRDRTESKERPESLINPNEIYIY